MMGLPFPTRGELSISMKRTTVPPPVVHITHNTPPFQVMPNKDYDASTTAKRR